MFVLKQHQQAETKMMQQVYDMMKYGFGGHVLDTFLASFYNCQLIAYWTSHSPTNCPASIVPTRQPSDV
jgi:hypothetical protein